MDAVVEHYEEEGYEDITIELGTAYELRSRLEDHVADQYKEVPWSDGGWLDGILVDSVEAANEEYLAYLAAHPVGTEE